MPRPDDNYGSYGSVPTVQNQGVSRASLSVKASPDAFGENVGEAVSGLGKQAQEINDHFAQVVTEAKVNDDYANKYIPAATQLKNQYDSLRGQDKVGGYEKYINDLEGLNKQFTTAQPGMVGQTSMQGLVNRYTIGERTSAQSGLVSSQKEFADKAAGDLIIANNGLAAQNYKNPELVDSIEQQNDNHVLIRHIDNGHDPNDPASQSVIADTQKGIRGQMASGMIKTAINSGDAESANFFRSRYASVIPGYEKLVMDNALHDENIKQTGNNAVRALTSGKPIPDAVGAPAAKVQALVANTAKTSTVNPNHALTVLRIESANGQNVGARGTLGQDKESAGKSLDEQAKALCDNLKSASDRASQVLGRPAEGWEAYAVYQQGAGGGAALLQADRSAKAIDVLGPLYKNPKDALAAINGNGGNSTMTVGDFTDHIKQLWTDNEKRANCDFGNAEEPGKAILKPHETTGETVQPGATPTQAWLNFEKKYPGMQAQIDAIPNYEVKAGVKKYIEEKRQEYSRAATAYKNVLVNQAAQLAAKPEFTSVDQIPAEMRAALATDSPHTLNYLQTKAEDNLNKASGANTKDQREYGAKFYELFNRVHSSSDIKINTVSELQKYVGPQGGLTISGYDKLENELKKSNNPETASEGQAKKLFYEYAKKRIAPYATSDKQAFNDFFIQSELAYQKGISAGKTPAQLLTSTSPDYLGLAIPQFAPTQTQLMGAKIDNNKLEATQIAEEVQKFNTMNPTLFPEYYKNAKDALLKPGIDEATKKKYTNTLLNLEIVAARRGLAKPKQSVLMAE